MRYRYLAVTTFLVCVMSLASCGPETDNPALPSPNVTTFEQGVFDKLPQLPRSEPFGPRSEKKGVVTRSYKAVGYTPAGVIDYFDRVLTGTSWTRTTPVYRADTRARGDWVTDERRLEVSATRVPDRSNASSRESVVQYSLVLRPRGHDA